MFITVDGKYGFLYGSITAPNTMIGTSTSEFTLTPSGPVVPEPSTAMVAGIGAVAFIAYGCSRHRRAQRRQAAA
jgi:hypothetical protein